VIDQGQIWHTRPDPHLCLRAKFRPDQFILSPVKGKNHQILPHFQIQHPMAVPSSGAETKLNVGAQTFHYPTISKTLLSYNAFCTQSFSQTVPFYTVRTAKIWRMLWCKNDIFWPSGQCWVFVCQSDRQKLNILAPRQHAVWAPLNLARDRGSQARPCSPECSAVWCTRGTENLGVTRHPQI